MFEEQEEPKRSCSRNIEAAALCELKRGGSRKRCKRGTTHAAHARKRTSTNSSQVGSCVAASLLPNHAPSSIAHNHLAPQDNGKKTIQNTHTHARAWLRGRTGFETTQQPQRPRVAAAAAVVMENELEKAEHTQKHQKQQRCQQQTGVLARACVAIWH